MWGLIAGAVGLVLVVVLLVTFLGGGKFAGAARPSLPDTFDGWSEGEAMLGLPMYEKDGEQVMVMEFDAPPEGQRNEEDAPVLDNGQIPDVDTSSPGRGIECGTASGSTACVILYEDYSGFMVSGDQQEVVEEAAVALSKT